jgi:hypothetical protein
MENLNTKYQPTTSATKVQLKLEFAQSCLTDANTVPDEWIATLERIRQRLSDMKAPISDEDMMVHVINNCPKEYDTLIETMENEIGREKDELTVERLRDSLHTKSHRIHKNDKKEIETALVAATSGKKGFKGQCRICAKYGHKGWQCPDKGKAADDKSVSNSTLTTKTKFEGNCGYCGFKGYKEVECFKKRREKKSEGANHAQHETSDTILMAQETKANHTVDKDTWLGDSGATSHMMHSLEGMFDVEKTRQVSESETGNNGFPNAR